MRFTLIVSIFLQPALLLMAQAPASCAAVCPQDGEESIEVQAQVSRPMMHGRSVDPAGPLPAGVPLPKQDVYAPLAGLTCDSFRSKISAATNPVAGHVLMLC